MPYMYNKKGNSTMNVGPIDHLVALNIFETIFLPFLSIKTDVIACFGAQSNLLYSNDLKFTLANVSNRFF